jgi:putative copper resistance protein D
MVVLSAVPLGLLYVGTWDGLIGTGYGSLVTIKSVLMGATLSVAAFSFHAVRAPGRARTRALRVRLPYLIEGEILLAVMILFTAASLSAQPPAVDMTADRATWSEVEVFRPSGQISLAVGNHAGGSPRGGRR